MQTPDISPVSSRQNAVQSTSKEQMRKVAHEFETLFSAMMLKAMRKTVNDNPLIPKSTGEDIFTGMLDDEYSKIMASNGSIGLADLIIKELERQERPDNALAELRAIGNAGRFAGDPRFMPATAAAMADATAVRASAQVKGTDKKLSRWNDLIARAARQSGVDRNLISAIVVQESGGNHLARSPKGAKGLMQLMDTTAASLGVRQPFSPWANISGGTRYFKQLLERFKGDERLALAAYNAGPGAVEKYGGIPPYAETQNYVNAVLSLRSQLGAAQSGEEQ